MTRVPTYATYMNMVNQTNSNKNLVDKYSYQSITGLKSQTYSGYGMSAYNIVSLEAALTVNQNFQNTNDIVNIEMKTMNVSLESISSSLSDFKSALTTLYGMELENMAPDYTGGEISCINDNRDEYNGKTITVNGETYTFSTADGTGNNIDISTANSAEDIMQALYNKIPDAQKSDMELDGAKLTFPRYTVDGVSSALTDENLTKLGEAYTMSGDQNMELKTVQNLAFTTMKAMVDSLNTFTNGKYLFGGGVASQAPISFPFDTLEDFQKYYDGTNITFPNNASANLSDHKVTGDKTGDITLDITAGTNQGSITA